MDDRKGYGHIAKSWVCLPESEGVLEFYFRVTNSKLLAAGRLAHT